MNTHVYIDGFNRKSKPNKWLDLEKFADQPPVPASWSVWAFRLMNS